MQQLGLTSQQEKDFFRGRVLFPIHSVSGKILGFGGRTLSADKNIPKYVNSPETEIYNKSRIVYGIHFARKAISQLDECFLVEGYMDVLSLHQAGIENTVASSGTSLTEDQVRLIKRYTKNLTIIYDGDAAGIKAALRGLQIALKEGLNVKVVILPKEDDPDTLIQKTGADGFLKYIRANKKDLIHLQTSLFLEEAKNDPAKLAAIIKEIVQSIALIPDSITRSLYLKQTSQTLNIEEQILISETNKLLRQKAFTDTSKQDRDEATDLTRILPGVHEQRTFTFYLDELQERDIIRLLLENSNFEVDGENAILKILNNLADVEIENELYKKVVEQYKSYYEKSEFIPQVYFINHEDEQIRKLATDILQSPYELSDNWWKMHDVAITDKQFLVKRDVIKSISLLKLKKITRMKMELDEKIKALQNESLQNNMDQITHYQKKVMELESLKKKLAINTGTVVMPMVK